MGFLKVRKPKAIMFDMCATMTKSHFMDQVLFPYFREAAKSFLEEYWSNEVVQEDIQRLREQSKADEGPVILADSEGEPAVRESLLKYIDVCMSSVPKRESHALSVLRFHVLFEGYSRNRLTTPVYSDVAFQVRHWVADLKIKLYIFSNCWLEASKRFLSHTNHGNMNLLIEDHFDNTIGKLDEAKTHTVLAKEKIQLPPEDILFLTHNVKEAHAAKQAGLSVLLVATHRRDMMLISQEEKDLPSIRSFNELAFTSDAPPAAQLPPGSTATDDDDSSSKGSSSSGKASSKASSTDSGINSSSKNNLKKSSSTVSSNKASTSSSTSKDSKASKKTKKSKK